MIKDIKEYVIPKPWGYEYLFFENSDIGIWFLHLNHKQSTSLHCHPDKKTGLIVLDGRAKISFLNDNRKLSSLGKLMIWSGVFHSTTCLSNGLDILEVETPKNKNNLIRIEDNYGRKGKSYESEESWLPRDSSHLWMPDYLNVILRYKHVELSISELNIELVSSLNDDDLIIILTPQSIITTDKHNICKIGDVINIKTIRRLIKEFTIMPNTKVLYIRKTWTF